MGKMILALTVIMAATLAHPAGAGAHGAVIVGAGPVVAVAPPACGGPYFYPGFAPPGFFSPWGAPAFGVRHSWQDYRWYYGQYFTPRSERIYGFTLPRRW